MDIIVSFLYLLLYLAIIILIAFGVRWVVTEVIGKPIDPNVDKWARIVVALLCGIATVVWLVGVLSSAPRVLPH